MSKGVLHSSRTRFVWSAAVAAVGGLACAATAQASPASSAAAHVRRADVALHAVASASAGADVHAALTKLTAQLGAAAELSAQLAEHPRTPQAARDAGAALSLLAREETKADALLGVRVAARAQADRDAIVKADLQVTEALQLALEARARLSGTANASFLDDAATLRAKASGLLAKLVVATTPGATRCSSPAVVAQLAANASADVVASVLADADATIAGTINAGGSLLATVTAQQLAELRARVIAQLGCTDGSGRGSGASPADAGAGVSGSVDVGASSDAGAALELGLRI